MNHLDCVGLRHLVTELKPLIEQSLEITRQDRNTTCEIHVQINRFSENARVRWLTTTETLLCLQTGQTRSNKDKKTQIRYDRIDNVLKVLEPELSKRFDEVLGYTELQLVFKGGAFTRTIRDNRTIKCAEDSPVTVLRLY